MSRQFSWPRHWKLSRPFLISCIAFALLGMGLGTGNDNSSVTSGANLVSFNTAAQAASKPRVKRHDRQASKLINAYRARYGLGPVRVDKVLTNTATKHALDLAANGITGHYGSDGADPARRALRNGYKYLNLGENASAGRTSLPDVIKAWIRSASHQPNMVLSPATDFGLAHIVAPASRHKHYWVLMIGKRRPKNGGILGNGFNGGFTGTRRIR